MGRERKMERCRTCGAETELHVNGAPVCLACSEAPTGRDGPALQQLSVLQRNCTRAMRVYIDLTEACSEILLSSEPEPLSGERLARFTELRSQEAQAFAAYIEARLELMAGLGVADPAAERELWLARIPQA